ncbi:MAG: glycosyltransferase family 9 protein [Endomicrobium sp.]|jgi:ADP-heptose:LPS heptosyltransferase|nr:glycosyltransferase family 9 protein [Endomicrobium sp.]
MKILIIKPSSFGDIVQAAACASALKKAYQGCKISWVVFKRWEELPDIFSDIDDKYVWDRKIGIKGFFKVLKEIRKTKFDIVMDLQGLLRSALLSRMSKGKIKIGIPGMKEFSSVLIKEIYPENAKMNATLRNLEPLRFLTGKKFVPEVNIKIGVDALCKAADILKKSGVKKHFIVLIPFARGKGKDWNVGNYLKLIDLIKNKYLHYDIVVLGSKNDYGKIKSENIIDICGKTSLLELAAVLSKSLLAVGADTGPMHLSAALNIPSIFIFGDSDVNETSPSIGKFSVVVNKENQKEINGIKPEHIFGEVQKWIK